VILLKFFTLVFVNITMVYCVFVKFAVNLQVYFICFGASINFLFCVFWLQRLKKQGNNRKRNRKNKCFIFVFGDKLVVDIKQVKWKLNEAKDRFLMNVWREVGYV